MSLPPIRYTVSVPEPRSHAFRIRMELEVAAAGPVRVSIPSWAPGSYLLREFARQVSSFSARTASGPLPCEKVARGTWEIVAPQAGLLRVEYAVNAQERSVRTPYLDEEFGFFVGTNVFALVEGALARPVEVRFELPADWTAFSSRIEGFVGRGFSARDYDELADCAVALTRSPSSGGPQVHRFEACGRPHGFVVIGDGALDLPQVLDATQACVEAAAELFGGGTLPYERYLFIHLFTESGRGGLEHLDSCALTYPRLGYQRDDGHVDYMMLVAHEYFHVWNIKRVRTDVLGPFDYVAENYTRDLWIGEGWTSYFQHHIGLRAGVIDAGQFLELMGKRLSTHESNCGRLVQSLEESSFDAWIKLYRPHADSPNTTVSYYLKGSLVACLLDLEIRRRTGDARSLLDVFGYLWREFGQRGVGYPEGTMQRQVEAVVGGDYTSFFDAYVRGTAELEWEAALSHVGLRRVEERASSVPWFGAAAGGPDGLSLGTVHAQGPARAAGLMAGDALVALDGYRVEPWGLDAMLRSYGPGTSVEVVYFREGRLRTTQLRLAEPRSRVRLKLVESPSAGQLASLRAWLGSLPDDPLTSEG